MSQSSETVTPLGHLSVSAEPKVGGPTARQWLLHATLFVITAATTTICGIMMAGPNIDHGPETGEGTGLIGVVFMIPRYYISGIWGLLAYAFAHPYFLGQGLIFSGSLLAILAAHESGHYLFCRYYGVEATLPFFIPQPPLLIPGTFGAFIKMKSPVPSRRALFDIGLAGPLAGFILIVPIAFAGVLTAHHLNIPPGEVPELTFNDPLLFRLIARLFRINLDNSVVNSFYLAAWVGSLVTALNLMPVGQLDGGHGTFSLFGQRAHWWIGRVAFVLMLITTIFGWLWFRSPVMLLYVVLLAVMLRVRHPQPEQMEPLGLARTIIGVVTLIVFALCFLPFPITIG
jgi:membrane-associated protease RseP (regulator of RpoE activity)